MSDKVMGRLLLAVVLLAFFGCSHLGPRASARLSDLRKEEVAIPAETVIVARADLQKAVAAPVDTNVIRLVEVFKGNEDPERQRPEYRLFEIQPGSAYELLGIKNGDVLVAVDDYVVRDPKRFPGFVALLTKEKGVSFELVRAKRPLMLNVKIEG